MTTPLANPLARQSPETLAASRNLKKWTRELLDLGFADIIFVNELACSVPGCAPRETVIVIMPAGQASWQVSIHKALVEITREDLVALVA
jgi:hypothetical protein